MIIVLTFTGFRITLPTTGLPVPIMLNSETIWKLTARGSEVVVTQFDGTEYLATTAVEFAINKQKNTKENTCQTNAIKLA